jgi:hypothetical protein
MVRNLWWLASYPKAGNTWLRAVLATLVAGKPVDINAMAWLGGTASNRRMFDDALGIASADLSFVQQMNLRPRVYEILSAEAARPLYCKTHDAYQLTPAGEPLFPATITRGAVYVVRDPRAVAVSFAHHSVRPLDDTISRMDDADAVFSAATARLSLNLPQRLLRWSEHVESWLAAPFPVHVLRYEDMWDDPHAAFESVATFLGIGCDIPRLAAAVEATSFARLQAQEREFGFSERPPHAAAFFRDGRTEGWRDVLTPEQAARIVASHGAVMRRLGYDVTLTPRSCSQPQGSKAGLMRDTVSHSVS